MIDVCMSKKINCDKKTIEKNKKMNDCFISLCYDCVMHK
jgi:hypothetical protein